MKVKVWGIRAGIAAATIAVWEGGKWCYRKGKKAWKASGKKEEKTTRQRNKRRRAAKAAKTGNGKKKAANG